MMLTGSLTEGEPLLAASEPQKEPRLTGRSLLACGLLCIAVSGAFALSRDPGVDATAPAARLDGDALTPTRPRAQQPTRHHTQHATTPAPTAASVGPLVNCTINQTNEIMPLMAVVSLTLENLPDDAEAGVNIALRYWPAAMGGSSDDIGKDGAPPAGALWSSVAFLNRSAPAAELNLFRLRAAQLHVAEVWASWPGGESMLETLTWTARGTGVPRFDSGSLAQIEGSPTWELLSMIMAIELDDVDDDDTWGANDDATNGGDTCVPRRRRCRRHPPVSCDVICVSRRYMGMLVIDNEGFVVWIYRLYQLSAWDILPEQDGCVCRAL